MDPASLFDVQVKRLHEYKRQLMNALHICWLYLQIKKGASFQPRTFLFGAKASPGYYMAKEIIRFICALGDRINRDPQAKDMLKVIFLADYKVSLAEIIYPAAEISEQISQAGKEASGTGNMKLMLNGAVTLGTLDGANVEIAQLVGPDNIYTFGASSDQVIAMYANHGYHVEEYYNRPWVKELVDFIISPTLLSLGDESALRHLWGDMKGKDWFMALLDVEEYAAVRDRAIADYGDRTAWARKMLVNTAKCGYFSSDRTIQQYADEIWHINPIDVK